MSAEEHRQHAPGLLNALGLRCLHFLRCTRVSVCARACRRYVDAALYLTELQADGVIGAVGVTNFDVPRLQAMVDAGAQIVSNQVRLAHARAGPAHAR